LPDVSIGATAHLEAAQAVATAQSVPATAAAPSTFAREVYAGLIAALLGLPFAVSAGVLDYAPLGSDYIAVGAATGILCAVVGGLVGALGRSSSFVVNAPSAPLALIQASFLSSLLTAFGGDAALTLAVAPLSIVLAGFWQVLFAWSGLVRIIKFAPYPVLAGFVTGLSLRTFVQQFPRLFDLPDPMAFWSALMQGSLPHLGMAAFGLAVVAIIRVSDILAPRVPAMLVGLASGTILWHLLLWAWPGLELGRTIGAMSLARATAGISFDSGALAAVFRNPDLLQPLLLTSATLAAVAMLDFTFTVRTAQSLADLRLSPRRDLAGQGVANLATAVLGGMATTSTLSSTTALFENGGRTRLSSAAMALLLLALAVGLGAEWRLIVALPLYALGTWLRVAEEEKLLRTAFGADYDAYAARVKRFVPGLL